jgi:acetyltransferase EpsM
VATRLVILGTHVFAEEVADLVEDIDGYEVAAFAENWDRERCSPGLLGREVVWIDDLAPWADGHHAICALGTTRRREFIEPVREMGFTFATLRHPTAVLAPSSTIGDGTLVGALTVVGAHSAIGSHVILNRGALIGHHANIANYVTVSPGANLAGRVTVGAGAYIGMGAVILDQLAVGEHSVIGAGSVVTRDVPARVQVVGVPARIVKEDVEGM